MIMITLNTDQAGVKRWCKEVMIPVQKPKQKGHSNSPRRPVYPEALDSDVRVLQVKTVREERLNIVKVLRFQLGDGGEAIIILLHQL